MKKRADWFGNIIVNLNDKMEPDYAAMSIEECKELSRQLIQVQQARSCLMSTIERYDVHDIRNSFKN